MNGLDWTGFDRFLLVSTRFDWLRLVVTGLRLVFWFRLVSAGFDLISTVFTGFDSFRLVEPGLDW